MQSCHPCLKKNFRGESRNRTCKNSFYSSLWLLYFTSHGVYHLAISPKKSADTTFVTPADRSLCNKKLLWRERDSNPRPAGYEPAELPTALSRCKCPVARAFFDNQFQKNLNFLRLIILTMVYFLSSRGQLRTPGHL